MSIFRVDVREDVRIEQTLEKIQIEMQQKSLMKATRKAAQVFKKEAERQAVRLKSEGRDRWGKVSEIPLHKSIKRVGVIDGTRTIGRTFTTGLAAAYAASLEYGHRMFIFGVQRSGERVIQHPFWRPSQDTTRQTIHQVIVSELKRELTRLSVKR